MKMKMKAKIINAGLAALSLGVLAMPVSAGINYEMSDAVQLGAENFTFLSVRTYVDWSSKSTVSGHSNFSTFTPPGKTAAVKYLTLTAFNPPSDGNSFNSLCFDVATTKTSSTTNADTEIWVKDVDGIWKVLSDDQDGTTLAHARVFLDPGIDIRSSANQRIRVAAFSSTHNSEQFYIRNTDLGGSMDPCFFDSPYPNVTFGSNPTQIIISQPI
jgi:hypothetical protein